MLRHHPQGSGGEAPEPPPQERTQDDKPPSDRKKKKRSRSKRKRKAEADVNANDAAVARDNGKRNTSSGGATATDRGGKRQRPNRGGYTNSRSGSGGGGGGRSFRPPSDAALALSATLKDLSSRKRLQEALHLYRDKSNDSIRDGHHGSIVVDCCSRCGDVEEGEKVMNAMRASGTQVSIQAKTALLKGYAHSGQMAKGADLYKSMCLSKDKRNRPNVRTLNTLLRGCLWTAASVYATADESNRQQHVVAGGVVTSEEAWRLSRSIGLVYDSSSYEYTIALLCQALRCNDAERRVEEMKQCLGILDGSGESFGFGDDTAMESLAAASLSLARAYALIGRRAKTLEHAVAATNAIEVASSSSSRDGGTGKGNKQSGAVTGGKRSWRKPGLPGSDDSRRASSNTLFRSHRLSEMKVEADSIIALCKTGLDAKKTKSLLAHCLMTRLLYFSGGGTTDLSALRIDERESRPESESHHVAEQLMTSLWLSFGLPASVGRSANLEPVFASSKSLSVLRKADLKAIRGAGLDPLASVLSDDGCIDFAKVFVSNDTTSCKGTPARPVHIELGAGSGDWIRTQAIAKPTENFVSVELRSDRVAQTFSKCMFGLSKSNEAIGNVCVVGSECGSFLRHRISKGSISTIFVNHPEPPTQTYGSSDQDMSAVQEGAEPAHMLNSETLLAAARCLEPGGKAKLIIVTDNKWYGSLICSTLEMVMRRNGKLLAQINLHEEGGYRRVDVAKDRNSRRIALYEGKPSEAIGHNMPKDHDSGSSYFDRLWRTGAGTHAEMKKRFVIALRTYDSDNDQRIGSTPVNTKGPHARKSGIVAHGGKDNKKPNKKKSTEKQQRRNERRLAKKLAAEKASD